MTKASNQPIKWNSDEITHLFLVILETHPIKIDYDKVVAHYGRPVSKSAIVQQLFKLKREGNQRAIAAGKVPPHQSCKNANIAATGSGTDGEVKIETGGGATPKKRGRKSNAERAALAALADVKPPTQPAAFGQDMEALASSPPTYDAQMIAGVGETPGGDMTSPFSAGPSSFASNATSGSASEALGKMNMANNHVISGRVEKRPMNVPAKLRGPPL